MANPSNQAHPTSFNAVRYIPASRYQAILASQVQSIAVAGYAKTSCGSGFTNHWCLYFQTPQNTSVRIDCQPSYSVPGTIISGGSKAFVIVSELFYALSNDAIKHGNLAVRPGLTVADVVNLLVAYGRHKYEFDAQGVGCRKWTTDQVDILEQQQLAVDGIQCQSVRQAILKL